MEKQGNIQYILTHPKERRTDKGQQKPQKKHWWLIYLKSHGINRVEGLSEALCASKSSMTIAFQ